MGKVSNAFDNVLNEYISFKDFLISISGKNKDPLYIALSYLISTKTYNDLQNSLYYIDIDYNINKIDVMPTVYGILKDLSSILFWNNQKWIYDGDMSYQNLQDDEVNRNIQTLMLVRISELNWFFFKKSDIYNNENLKIILNIKQSNTNAIDKITTLQNQLDQAHARIAELENQSGNKELPTRTANNASKIILAMAELLGWDLSKPFSDETNGKIREILEKQRTPLSKDTVADWLKQAYDIGK